MKKIFAILALVLASFCAQAQTTTLGPTTAVCPNRVCGEVPNNADPAVMIGISASTLHQAVTVYIDEKPYQGDRTTSVVTDTKADSVCTAADGSRVTVTSTWSWATHHVNNGRAHYTITVWALTGGTVTLN